MPRLLLLTPAELTRDPRARRAAAAARAQGLGVVGVCGRISGEEPAPLDAVEVIRVGRRGRTHAAWTSGTTARSGGAFVRELRGLARLGRLVIRTAQLVRGARAWGRVDIVHANDFATLPAGYLVAREGRSRLVYDAHELYADFEVDPPRLATLISRAVEGVLARRADAVVTVSAPLAAELQDRFHLRAPPLVVLNAPELAEVDPRPPASGRLRAIYQGAFGPGRTLDDLLGAVGRAPNVELTLRVPRVPAAALRAQVDARAHGASVAVEEPVGPDDVVRSLAGFEVGIVFDQPLTRNAELGLPNKVFEYLMAGLAIVVPRLPALADLVESTGAGVTFEPGRPDALAAALEELARDRDRLLAHRRDAREAAATTLNADAQRPVLALAWNGPPRGRW